MRILTVGAKSCGGDRLSQTRPIPGSTDGDNNNEYGPGDFNHINYFAH